MEVLIMKIFTMFAHGVVRLLRSKKKKNSDVYYLHKVYHI